MRNCPIVLPGERPVLLAPDAPIVVSPDDMVVLLPSEAPISVSDCRSTHPRMLSVLSEVSLPVSFLAFQSP